MSGICLYRGREDAMKRMKHMGRGERESGEGEREREW